MGNTFHSLLSDPQWLWGGKRISTPRAIHQKLLWGGGEFRTGKGKKEADLGESKDPVL